MMFHADKKIGENLGGVILHHETIYQTDDSGKRKSSFEFQLTLNMTLIWFGDLTLV